MTSDQTSKGVLLAFASMALFSFSDASVKLIDGELPPYESAFFGAVFALAIVPYMLRNGGHITDVFKTSNRTLWILRFIAYPAGVIGSVTAFTHLSMAEAFVLIFLQPAYVTIMSVFFLKEKVGIRRWSAVIIGFIGVLIVLRPGMRPLSIGHLGAIFAGLGGAISIVTFRAVGQKENQLSLIGAGILGALIVCGVIMAPTFQFPNGEQWAKLASYGILAVLANLVIMQATARAPANLISPTQYSQMLWAILIGYLIFGDHVDGPMIAGIVLIVGSGMLTLMRERVRGTPLPPAVAGEQHAPAALATDEIDMPSKDD